MGSPSYPPLLSLRAAFVGNVHDGLSVVAKILGIIQLRGCCLNTLWCQISVRRSKIYHELNTRCKTNKIVWWLALAHSNNFGPFSNRSLSSFPPILVIQWSNKSEQMMRGFSQKKPNVEESIAQLEKRNCWYTHAPTTLRWASPPVRQPCNLLTKQ